MKIFVEGTKRAAVSRMFPIWESLGHEIVATPSKADVQFSSVRIVNRSGLPTLLRIDGICYDKGVDYIQKNQAISNSHRIADAVVYQSELSKRMCEQYLTSAKTKIKEVIYNGLDVDGWNNPQEHDGFNIFACAKWRRPKRLEEIIHIFNLFRRQCPHAMLHIIGPFVKRYKPIDSPNVIYYGAVDFPRMKALYQRGDAFIHMCKKDSCPSVVVEAMAAGMPVVTTNACGGATEMAGLVKGCIVVEGEHDNINPEYIYQDACHQVPEKVQQGIVDSLLEINMSKYRVEFPEELFSIETIAKHYLNVLERIV